MGARPDAIAQAYRAFAVPTPASLGVCNCGLCLDPDLERTMLRKQPADLTLDEVREWLSAEFRDTMNRQLIAWIMPRVLDLLVDGAEVEVVGNEVALRRLRNAGFPDEWTLAQVAAVISACHPALDRHVAARSPDFDGLLCMIANSGLNISPFLARLDAVPDDTLVELLRIDLVPARSRSIWRRAKAGRIWRTPFWEDVPGREAVWNWYTSTELEARMWRAGSMGNVRAVEVAEVIAQSPAVESSFR